MYPDVQSSCCNEIKSKKVDTFGIFFLVGFVSGKMVLQQEPNRSCSFLRSPIVPICPPGWPVNEARKMPGRSISELGNWPSLKLTYPLHIGHSQRKQSYSNHPFSFAILSVPGRIVEPGGNCDKLWRWNCVGKTAGHWSRFSDLFKRTWMVVVFNSKK